jgi:uncharacterized protein
MSGSYILKIGGLKEGHYHEEFKIGKEFFEQFEESEIKEGALVAIVDMEKRISHIDMVIKISGEMKVACDRCLAMFMYPINCTNRLIVNFQNDQMEDSDPDIISVPSDEEELDLKQHFYDFVILSLPIRRVHPLDNKGKSTCDPEMLRKLNKLIIEEEKVTDPRWDELKKLMNNN